MRILKDWALVFLAVMVVVGLAWSKVEKSQAAQGHMGIFPAHKGMDNRWSCPDNAIAVQPYDQDPNPWPFFFVASAPGEGQPFNSFPGFNGGKQGYWMYMTPNIVPPICVAKD